MELTLAHWFYLAGTLIILLTMLFRKNVVVPAIIATFAVAFAYTGTMEAALQSTFRASLEAATSLFDIFLIIAIMTALLAALQDIGADEKMITPLQKWMINGHVSFFVLIVITYVISLFFWPTPAVPLVGAILIPVAVRAGLPPLAAGVAIALAGQGMALSSDYIIQIAPSLSASAGNLDVATVADRALILSLITGVIAIGLAYLFIRKSIRRPDAAHLQAWKELDGGKEITKRMTQTGKETQAKLFAVLVPLTFLGMVAYMVYEKISRSGELDGGGGAAFIGGAACLLLIITVASSNWKTALEKVSDHIINGFLFAFKAMGVVLPIAGFFFLGNDENATVILGNAEGAPAFLFDLILAAEPFIPHHDLLAAFGILIIGMITGLDGSGFSGLPLTGSLSGPLSSTMGMDAATLAALGQMGAIWVGGGTLIAWSSLVAVAGFAKVPVMELVRKCFLPVICGLFAAACLAVWIF